MWKKADRDRELQSVASSSGIKSLGIENRGLDDVSEDLESEQPALSFSRLSNSLESRRLSKLAERDYWLTPPPSRAGTITARSRERQHKDPLHNGSSSSATGFHKQKKNASDYETVQLKRGIKDELGFKIEGGLTTPSIPDDPGIFVKYTIPGTPAHSKLHAGDRILAVNDVNISCMSRKDAKDVISNATGSVVALYVKRATQRQQTIENVMARGENGKERFFTKEQVEEFEDAFSLFNKDGSGSIKTTKVFNLIRSLGHNPAEHAVWVYLNELGLTANCSLTFEDFVDLMTVIVAEQSPEYEATSASNVFDTEERGFVTVEELHEAFDRMPGRDRMKDTELKEILKQADPAGRGIIRLKEFQNLLQPSITQY